VAGIFICYRREDSAGWAGRLAADLVTGLPGVRIFRDVEAIPPGVKFEEYITQAIGSSEVFIALIGPHWLTLTDENSHRRLDDPKDFIRLEISTCLKCDIRIIPALVGGVAVPKTADLPEDLRPLAQRQFYKLDDHRWADDCRRLIADLKPLVRPAPRPTFPLAAALLVVLGLAAFGVMVWTSRPDSSVGDPIGSVSQGQLPVATSAEQRAIPTSSDPSLAQQKRASTTPSQSSPESTVNPGNADTQESGRGQPGPARSAEGEPAREARDISARVDRAYQEALAWQMQADESARTASDHARSAEAASKDILVPIPRDVFDAARPEAGAVRQGASAAREAATRAADWAGQAQEAVTAARAKADEALKARTPTDAAFAAGAVSLAAEAARSAAARASQEAEASRNAATSAAQAKDRLFAVMSRSAQRRDAVASSAESGPAGRSSSTNVGMVLEVSGAGGTARAGNAAVSEYNSASILVVAQDRQTGAPIVTLAPRGHTGTQTTVIPLPRGWNLDVRMVPPGGCVLEPTHTYNDGSGAYTLSVMTVARDGPCPWLKGEYQFTLRINIDGLQGQALGRIVID
jgi:hypothetical protein